MGTFCNKLSSSLHFLHILHSLEHFVYQSDRGIHSSTSIVTQAHHINGRASQYLCQFHQELELKPIYQKIMKIVSFKNRVFTPHEIRLFFGLYIFFLKVNCNSGNFRLISICNQVHFYSLGTYTKSSFSVVLIIAVLYVHNAVCKQHKFSQIPKFKAFSKEKFCSFP